MTFLHPWAIYVGVAAAAVPLLVHFLTRPRPLRLPLSTLRFVREAVHQQRSWHRLRDWLILALRTLAVLLLALAVARPQWGKRRQLIDLPPGDAVRVVLLDVSQSMAARQGSVTQIERGRTVAAKYLRYRPGLTANLILAGARPQATFDSPSTNFDALRDELARCQPLPQRVDVNRALDLAARILTATSSNDRRRRELVIVSDFQRSSWASADFAPLPADVQIQLESTAPAAPLENLAILHVAGRTSASLRGTQLDVEVGNYTAATRKVAVEVAVGNASWRLTGVCPAGRATTLSEEIGSLNPGWQPGEARLVGVDDALAADNTYAFVLHVRPQPTYVLLTRQAAGHKVTSSLFLQCALAPSAGNKRQTPSSRNDKWYAAPRVVRIDPAVLEPSAAAAGDLVVLDHPGKLADDAIKLLAALLHRGRPILYVAAEPIDATNLKRLGDSVGGGLQMPVEFAPPPAGHARRNLFFTTLRRDSPPLAVFGDSLSTVAGQLRFGGGLSSRRLESGLESDVLATYDDGSAGIVLCATDAGALAVLNADLALSNLPKTGAFVPMLTELIEQMLDHRRVGDGAVCGEPLVVHLPAEAGSATGLTVHRVAQASSAAGKPSEADAAPCGELADETVGAVWRCSAAPQPAVYRVERAGDPVFALAVNAPAEESRLETLPHDVLTARLAAGRSVVYHGATDEDRRPDDLWKWLAVACVLCILGEMSALLAFRT
jgi:hypothetical protein